MCSSDLTNEVNIFLICQSTHWVCKSEGCLPHWSAPRVSPYLTRPFSTHVSTFSPYLACENPYHRLLVYIWPYKLVVIYFISSWTNNKKKTPPTFSNICLFNFCLMKIGRDRTRLDRWKLLFEFCTR